jgi:hypothetical protein
MIYKHEARGPDKAIMQPAVREADGLRNRSRSAVRGQARSRPWPA